MKIPITVLSQGEVNIPVRVQLLGLVQTDAGAEPVPELVIEYVNALAEGQLAI